MTKLRIVCGMRAGESPTNFRAALFAAGMEKAGHVVVYQHRKMPITESTDLYIQAGFQGSYSLRKACDLRIPFIIGEMPAFRRPGEFSNDDKDFVSYQYNGLQGNGWYVPAPNEERPKPILQPMRDPSGETMIVGQKGNDQSLRGTDHHAWIRAKLEEYPDAVFRPHPMMVTKYVEPLAEQLERTYKVITYSSTVGVDAVIAGCISQPECPGSMAYGVTDREQWLHDLSWAQFTVAECATQEIAEYILSGYDEARQRAVDGLVEQPRGRMQDKCYQYESDDIRVTKWR